MKRFFTISLLVFSTIALLGFLQSNRHKVHILFKKQKHLFEDLTTEGRPDLKKCYIHKGQILGLRQITAHTSLHGLNLGDQQALYINAYNLAILAELNEHYPIQSIEEIPDFYNSQPFKVAKQSFNLKSLRTHLISQYRDPRIHFTLYLGGLSSPKIPTNAFSQKSFDKEISTITSDFLNNPQYVKVKSRSKMLLLPEFMLWYIKDFERADKQGYIQYINKFRKEDQQIPSSYTVDFYPYSWKLEQ